MLSVVLQTPALPLPWQAPRLPALLPVPLRLRPAPVLTPPRLVAPRTRDTHCSRDLNANTVHAALSLPNPALRTLESAPLPVQMMPRPRLS